MKKRFSLLLAAAMLLTLAACGTKTNAPNTTEATSVTETSSLPIEETSAETTAVPTEETKNGNPLIVYFSWSGNTAKLAQMIADETGGDLFAIEPETPYSEDYNTVLDQAKEEQRKNARPAVAGTVENWEDYDTVFIGWPTWWGDVPRIMLSFAESYDWSGKTVAPFGTSGGSGFAKGLSSMTDAAAGATMLDGLQVSSSRVNDARSDVTAWIVGLK